MELSKYRWRWKWIIQEITACFFVVNDDSTGHCSKKAHYLLGEPWWGHWSIMSIGTDHGLPYQSGSICRILTSNKRGLISKLCWRFFKKETCYKRYLLHASMTCWLSNTKSTKYSKSCFNLTRIPYERRWPLYSTSERIVPLRKKDTWM